MIGLGYKRGNAFSLEILIIRLSCIVFDFQTHAWFNKLNLFSFFIPVCSCQGTCSPNVSSDIRFISIFDHEPPSGDHGTVVPPVPIPNTEVKRCCADDSWAIGPAKVGRCQIQSPHLLKKRWGVFLCMLFYIRAFLQSLTFDHAWLPC